MPEALPIPHDLIALQQASDQARAAADEYAARITAVYRERYPDPLVKGRPLWSEDQALLRGAWTEDEHAELSRLRADARGAVVTLYRHPVLARARDEGSSQQTKQALEQAGQGDSA
jgi:hypothetical protein